MRVLQFQCTRFSRPLFFYTFKMHVSVCVYECACVCVYDDLKFLPLQVAALAGASFARHPRPFATPPAAIYSCLWGTFFVFKTL